ncbi:MAG: HlyD family efflux transporter periplasmic adaptor subunit [Pirellulales bacterium]
MTATSKPIPPERDATTRISLAHTLTPRAISWLARLIFVVFLAIPFALALAPWQQTVMCRGTIVAYSPVERMQVITARVSGQVQTWHVVEGSRVKLNDPLVDIEDADPELAARLEAQREFLTSRISAARQELTELAAAAKAQEAAREAAMRAAEANREAAQQAITVTQQVKANATFARDFELSRYEMFDDLFTNPRFGGLESKLNRDEARMRADRALTDTDKADAEIARARAALLTQEAMLVQADATGLSAIAVARSNLRKAEQNLFSIEREIQEIDNRIERFKARRVLAPCAGVVFRVSANLIQGGQYVTEGDELCTIVPDTSDRVAELFLDGVDAPIVLAYADRQGAMPHVRLQFEGWPAVQFSGWPELAIGTFGGKIRQIDAASGRAGQCRILVEPERVMLGDQWPDSEFLRQGNQVVGWVFLNRVPLGFEIWRRLNGFPPVLAPVPKATDEPPKPPKIKVG